MTKKSINFTHDASTQEKVVLVDVQFASSLEDLCTHVEREEQLVSLKQTTTCIPTAERQQAHTHTFNGPLSGTTRKSRYQKGKTNLDFTEARDSEWQCHQLGGMQVCTSLQTDNHASTPPLSFFTGQMPFLPPNQQRQSTEDNKHMGPNTLK